MVTVPIYSFAELLVPFLFQRWSCHWDWGHGCDVSPTRSSENCTDSWWSGKRSSRMCQGTRQVIIFLKDCTLTFIEVGDYGLHSLRFRRLILIYERWQQRSVHWWAEVKLAVNITSINLPKFNVFFGFNWYHFVVKHPCKYTIQKDTV